jgi:ribulose-bisphosphate carboxylase large chain
MKEKKQFQLSDQRFEVTYLIYGDERTSYSTAVDICLEQSVEFPGELLPEGFIKDTLVGRIESFELKDDGRYRTVISYHVDTASEELTQLLNVIFGNISIKPNIRVEKLNLPQLILKNFRGPRFGTKGIREILDVGQRQLLATALKPMGLSSEKLADYAYQFALGGIDIIKDDHGLSNQHFSPFEERVKLCTNAVKKANQITGKNCIYAPNVTAPFGEVMKRAELAKELGAGGILISPGLTGFDAMRAIADNDEIGLPIMSHPAFLGSFVNGLNGISHYALFGQIMRLAGADTVVYPNYGGRFSFSKEECESIAAGATSDMGHIKSILPAPGGGMTMEKIPDMLKTYGQDVIFLVGGGLFKQGPDLAANARYFSQLLK